MKNYILYKIVRPIIKNIMKSFYRVEIINSNNIPTEGKCILAGNHTNNLDPLLLMSSTKRIIRFMAKKEIHKGIFKHIFLSFGTIPVNRSIKDENAKKMAINALNEGSLLCIFPEGTINRTKEIILPFKYGTVSFASKTKSSIVPFVIKGKYKLFRKSLKIKFLKPYYIVSDDLEKENAKLMNIIKEELERNND